KRPRTPGDGVLVEIGVDGLACGVLQNFGRWEIRVSLRQIHRAVLDCYPRHLADDALHKALCPGAAEARAAREIGRFDNGFLRASGHFSILLVAFRPEISSVEPPVDLGIA